MERAGTEAETAAQLLRGRLASSSDALAASERQCKQLTEIQASLELQLAVVRREYRANDILVVGLRDRIGSLVRQLADSQGICSAQVGYLGPGFSARGLGHKV